VDDTGLYAGLDFLPPHGRCNSPWAG
jgi:hypothetical protein